MEKGEPGMRRWEQRASILGDSPLEHVLTYCQKPSTSSTLDTVPTTSFCYRFLFSANYKQQFCAYLGILIA